MLTLETSRLILRIVLAAAYLGAGIAHLLGAGPVPRHHARLGAPARVGHRRDGRGRDFGSHGFGRCAPFAPYGRRLPRALCRVRLSGEHQARG